MSSVRFSSALSDGAVGCSWWCWQYSTTFSRMRAETLGSGMGSSGISPPAMSALAPRRVRDEVMMEMETTPRQATSRSKRPRLVGGAQPTRERRKKGGHMDRAYAPSIMCLMVSDMYATGGSTSKILAVPPVSLLCSLTFLSSDMLCMCERERETGRGGGARRVCSSCW